LLSALECSSLNMTTVDEKRQLLGKQKL